MASQRSPSFFGALENPWQTKLGFALRQVLREGYDRRSLRADLLSGVVVGIVALPLSLALAIASGVPPQHGLYTAIVAGAVVAALGGSRVQVSGPTAAFVAVLAPIAAQYGVGGLLVATTMAGVMLLLMGVAGLGGLIQYIPYPVTSGFTAGIALVIGTLQVKDFLGLDVALVPPHYLERVWTLAAALPSARWPDALIGAGTLLVLVHWSKVSKRIPSPLAALALAAIAAAVLQRLNPAWSVDTIQTRFSYWVGDVQQHGIPRLPPLPNLPWAWPGPDGTPFTLTFDIVRTLVSSAFAIAMLGAIESLLSCVVADGMTGQQHDPDAELMAQGIGNIAAPFFGGIAATGAIARTATNVRSGARSPFAAITHAVFILLAVLLFAPILGYLPMAALAALLLIVAWNMSEVRHVAHTLRHAPTSDALVMVACFALTVLFDMTVAVTFGVLLASMLFMKRMAEVSAIHLVGPGHPSHPPDLPKGILIYEVTGALFFGAAQKAMSTLRTVQAGVKVVVLDLRNVSAIDATGLVNLESTIRRLETTGVKVLIGGLQHQPARALAKADWRKRHGFGVFLSFEKAVEQARGIAAVLFLCLSLLSVGSLAAAAEGVEPARFYPTRYFPGVADSSASQGVVLRHGETSRELLILMERSGGALRGELRTAVGDPPSPAAGVFVEAIVGRYRVGTLTGSDGTFRIEGVPAGEARVRYSGDSRHSLNKGTRAVFHPGCEFPNGCTDSLDAPLFTVMDGVENSTPLLGMTLPGHSVRGVVRGGDAPIARARVRILGENDGRWSARTDALGRYWQTGLPAGGYRIWVDASGSEFVSEYYGGARTFDAATVVALGASEDPEGLDLDLDVGGRIVGVVREEGTGNAISSVPIVATETTTGVVARGETNEVGLYTLVGLAAGSYRLFCPDINEYYPNGFEPGGARPVRVAEGATVPNVDFTGVRGGDCRLSPAVAGKIVGLVRAPFDEMASATLIAEPIQGLAAPGDTARLVVTAQGAFSMPCVKPGLYRMRIEPHGPFATQYYLRANRPRLATPVEVLAPPDSSTGVDFEPKASVVLRGRVADEISGIGLPDVPIRAREDTTGVIAVGRTDPDGSFLLERLPDGTGLPAGRWHVRAESTLVPQSDITPVLQPALDAEVVNRSSISLRWRLDEALSWSIDLARVTGEEVVPLARALDGRATTSWVDEPGTGTHRYHLRAWSDPGVGGASVRSEAWTEPISITATSGISLAISPNPVGSRDDLRWEISGDLSDLRAPLSLRVVDLAGREVARGDWPRDATQTVRPLRDRSGRPLPSGVYFARIEAGDRLIAHARFTVAPGSTEDSP